MRWTFALVCVAVPCFSVPAWALESDQFTPPPHPLIDIGPALSRTVEAQIVEVAARFNRKLLRLRHKAALTHARQLRQRCRRRIRELRTPTRITHAVAQQLSGSLLEGGLLKSKLGAWISEGPLAGEATVFDPPVGETALGDCALVRPLLIVEIAPTVRVHGVYVGTDKITHFVDIGYRYYEIYMEARERGVDPRAAIEMAVDYGVRQEKGVLGQWPAGLYSNADLAANYAGFMFYRNLARPILIAGEQYPPILTMKKGIWQINPDRERDLLACFFSRHLNEAMNPPWVALLMRPLLRDEIRERRSRWFDFYDITPSAYARQLRRLTTWHGRDYGHCGLGEGVITLLDAIP